MGLPGLSQEQVQVQLCQALLRSARFNLAKRYLTGQPHSKASIPQNIIERQACHSASQWQLHIGSMTSMGHEVSQSVMCSFVCLFA